MVDCLIPLKNKFLVVAPGQLEVKSLSSILIFGALRLDTSEVLNLCAIGTSRGLRKVVPVGPGNLERPTRAAVVGWTVGELLEGGAQLHRTGRGGKRGNA